jgi:hypothetical protein
MTVGWQIVFLIASMVISYAMAPKVVPPAPAAFESFDFPLAEEGTPQCVIFGDCWSGDWTVLGYGNFYTYEIEADSGK